MIFSRCSKVTNVIGKPKYFSSVSTVSSLHGSNLASVADPVPSLKGKNLVSIADLSDKEFKGLLDQAAQFKDLYKIKKCHDYHPLAGESLAMIFQKRSTRTRISTEVGMQKLGGQALFLSSDDIQLGVNESMKDTALVLSRFNSIILARVFGHKDIVQLAEEATVPVINALSDLHHPLQALADYLTLREHFGKLEGKTIAWVGDGNNVLHDLMLGAPKLGMNVRVATPTGYEPSKKVIAKTMELAKTAGTEVHLTDDPVDAVKQANVIVTDTWISMGQEKQSLQRLKDFEGYKVNSRMFQHASKDCVFLHCLPRHKEEVSDEVFYSKQSLVFDEAENRMWTVMAVMSSLLGK